MLIEDYNTRQYRLRVWFAYRYFCQSEKSLENERFRQFYLVLDKFFLHKYRQDTEENTRLCIKSLFKYESEQNIIINDDTINAMIDRYEANPSLLTVKL